MTGKPDLFPYPERRVLEDAAHVRGAWPTRIFAVLLPVWSVTVQATVLDAEDYDLIDRYLERGLAEGGLTTTTQLADFFALDEVHVDRALRFLAAIGHVRRSADTWTLTDDLGRPSVRDGKRYLLTRQDRRTMYFDGFGSHPLPRVYYESRKVTFLSDDQLSTVLDGRGGPRFFRLPFAVFRQDALAELARLPNREQYNLPEGIERPRSLDEALVHLPLYLVRTVDRAGRTRWLAYSQADDTADDHMTSLVQQAPSIVSALENEEITAARFGDDESRAIDWLRKKNLERHRPVRLDNGAWQVVLPAAAFLGRDQLSTSIVGSFIVQGNSLCHVWCTDENVRRNTMLERMDSYVSAHTRLDRANLEQRLAAVARQLDLGSTSVSELRQLADQAGRPGLASRLRRLES